jgi:hypothetical protein
MGLIIEEEKNLLHLADSKVFRPLAVVLTVLLLGELHVNSYMGCYAELDGDYWYVYAYADGPQVEPRAVWSRSDVRGVEHYGDHAQFKRWHGVKYEDERGPLLGHAAPPAKEVRPTRVVEESTPEGGTTAHIIPGCIEYKDAPRSHADDPDPIEQLAPEKLDEENGDVTPKSGTGTLKPKTLMDRPSGAQPRREGKKPKKQAPTILQKVPTSEIYPDKTDQEKFGIEQPLENGTYTMDTSSVRLDPWTPEVGRGRAVLLRVGVFANRLLFTGWPQPEEQKAPEKAAAPSWEPRKRPHPHRDLTKRHWSYKLPVPVAAFCALGFALIGQ